MGRPRSAETAETLRQRCPRCGAEPSERCRSKTGLYQQYRHVDRWYAAVRARKEVAADGT